MTLSKGAFAREIGFSASAVTKWLDAGMPAERSGNRGRMVKIDTAKAIPWLVAKVRNERTETAASERAKLDAERRRGLIRENDIAEGTLMPVADAEAAARATARVVIQSLDGIPGRVAALLADVDDPGEIASILRREIRAARAAIAGSARRP